jgi:hypothetical protein
MWNSQGRGSGAKRERAKRRKENFHHIAAMAAYARQANHMALAPIYGSKPEIKSEMES